MSLRSARLGSARAASCAAMHAAQPKGRGGLGFSWPCLGGVIRLQAQRRDRCVPSFHDRQSAGPMSAAAGSAMARSARTVTLFRTQGAIETPLNGYGSTLLPTAQSPHPPRCALVHTVRRTASGARGAALCEHFSVGHELPLCPLVVVERHVLDEAHLDRLHKDMLHCVAACCAALQRVVLRCNMWCCVATCGAAPSSGTCSMNHTDRLHAAICCFDRLEHAAALLRCAEDAARSSQYSVVRTVCAVPHWRPEVGVAG